MIGAFVIVTVLYRILKKKQKNFDDCIKIFRLPSDFYGQNQVDSDDLSHHWPPQFCVSLSDCDISIGQGQEISRFLYLFAYEMLNTTKHEILCILWTYYG